jgi:hypothetical protein
VLLVPAFARIVGAAVLILLVGAMVAAIAESAPAPEFDATVPTCRGWWVLAADDRPPAGERRPMPPCHPGWERSPSSKLCVPDCRPTCMKTRIAEATQRPPPVPQIGAGCPPGYNASPTSGTCTPSVGTRCRAFPSTGSCPTGWTYSPTSRMCLESHC